MTKEIDMKYSTLRQFDFEISGGQSTTASRGETLAATINRQSLTELRQHLEQLDSTRLHQVTESLAKAAEELDKRHDSVVKAMGRLLRSAGH